VASRDKKETTEETSKEVEVAPDKVETNREVDTKVEEEAKMAVTTNARVVARVEDNLNLLPA
jgi:hypothetical protein